MEELLNVLDNTVNVFVSFEAVDYEVSSMIGGRNPQDITPWTYPP